MQEMGECRHYCPLGRVLVFQVPLISDGANGEGKQGVVKGSSNKGKNQQQRGRRWRKGRDATLGRDDRL